MSRLSPERLEQIRERIALRPREHPVRVPFTPIKYTPWWAPWRGWILAVAWFFFNKNVSAFRVIFLWMCATLFAVMLISPWLRSETGAWVYCVLWGNPCFR